MKKIIFTGGSGKFGKVFKKGRGQPLSWRGFGSQHGGKNRQKCLKSNSVMEFLLTNVKKTLVLLYIRSQMMKNHWFYCVFVPKC